jgi:hypothetical protein
MHLEPTVEAHAGFVGLDHDVFNSGHVSSFRLTGPAKPAF